MTNLTANDIITKVIFPSWKEACDSFLNSEMHIFSCWEAACKNFLNSEMDILKFAKVYFDNVKKIEIDEKLNIFTAIAEKYRYENLHSDLLKVILGNEKNNINNKNIFNKFLDDIIKISQTDKSKYFPHYDEIKFHREYPKGKEDANYITEYGLIDLLIYTDEACIIIENKINGAPDQPNQLGKYYARMKKEGKKVIKTVYLTIDSKHSEPSNFNDYDQDFKVSKTDLKFKHLPCVTAEETVDKSFTKFLEEIISEKESIGLDKTQEVFIEQYKLLLEYIGGQVLMEQYKKEFIKKIMEKRDYIQTAKYFADNFKRIWDNQGSELEKQLVEKINENGYAKMANDLAKDFKEIWDHRTTIIGELLVDEEDITDFEMKIAPDDPTIRQKEIYPKVNIYYTAENPKYKKCIEFGFRPPVDEAFDDEKQEKLQKTFTSLTGKNIFKFDCPEGSSSSKWVCLQVSNLSSFEYKEIKAKLKECLETLKKEAMNVLPHQRRRESLSRAVHLNLQNK